MGTSTNKKTGFGTAPVFLTAISTILGAILFLRFGFVVGSVGFLGALAIIGISHLVTIPTAMAIAEIATNEKVEGGGEYYIISRSFGLNIGAAIGVALFLSQAISVAFYVIAFSEAFKPVLGFLNATYDMGLNDIRIVSIPALVLLGILMLTKGADVGVKALYVVAGILILSIIMFFLGSPIDDPANTSNGLFDKIQGGDGFFIVFAICFPAFTGMTAGVGLSGDLKDPRKSIPLGTLAATLIGMVIYMFLAYKFSVSAKPEDLVNDQLIMSRIALWGPIIPIGLACATVSSALGSILVAPRTLQALAADKIFPNTSVNNFLSTGKGPKKEPMNATIASLGIAFVFVALGNVDMVARVISMFFMVTYGALCLISFLQHFSGDPSYRPSFRSRWYISLLGAVLCIFLMFKMQPLYAILSILFMVLLYVGISSHLGGKQGIAKIFQGFIFQLSRRLQTFLQKADKEAIDSWRPSVICISEDSFERTYPFELMKWISYQYGFGTYLHFVNGYVSKESLAGADKVRKDLIKRAGITNSNVYIDTLISPSQTTAIAQSIQLPSVSGKDFNTYLFEFFRDDEGCGKDIIENLPLVKAAGFDLCILSSSERGFGFNAQIHIWITQNDIDNASLMILLSYVIAGHPDWKKAQIKIFAIFPEDEIEEENTRILELIEEGRLPITKRNVELIASKKGVSDKEIIKEKSKEADLSIIGFRAEGIKQLGKEIFEGYNGLGNILFVNSINEKEIA
ncbi:MAG: amino acid permease [Reichenbachiella sp.]|uniref:amino acid permease n=1 Tax=Reichenbachiella sp. TaxID=2184521 RepID=UPI003264DBED